MAPELFRAELNARERALLRAMGRRTCPITVAETALELGVSETEAETLLRGLAAAGLVKWDYRLPVKRCGWLLGIVGAHVARCVEREDAAAVNDHALALAQRLNAAMRERDEAIKEQQRAVGSWAEKFPGVPDERVTGLRPEEAL